MRYIGHGIDIVEISRIEHLIALSDEHVSGWFSSDELEALGNAEGQAKKIAGRIAAKEAIAKALGTGFDSEVSWQDIAISSTGTGAPVATLSRGALAVAERMMIHTILISISYTGAFAMASAIAIGD